MFIDAYDPLALWTNIIDKESGKSYSDMKIYLVEWDTKTKKGKYHDGEFDFLKEGEDIPKKDITLPNAKTIIRIPESYPCNLELIKKLISNDEDVELIIDN